MDFVYNQLISGREIRVVAIVDTFSRLLPAIDPRFSCRGKDAIRMLEQFFRQVDSPRAIRVGQGSYFISYDLDSVPIKRT